MKTSIGRWLITTTATAAVVVSVAGIGAVFAQEPETTPTPTLEQRAPNTSTGDRTPGTRGGWGNRAGRLGGSTGLAEALGITEAELQAAQEQASAAALAQAVAEGELTQEEADAMQERLVGRGFHRHGISGHGADGSALLADALGISVEELEAAREQAQANALAAAVADGILTQEQADLQEAKQALREYVDQDAILAGALGMTVEELEAVREDGERLSEIIEARGLERETVEDAIRSGYEDAVQAAVAAGAVTQAQADEILSDARSVERGLHGFGGGRGHHDFGEGRSGPRGERESSPAVTPGSDS